MSRQVDAIVVGAGPAGATAAYWLARFGARVLLLEKESLPRYKSCAGGLTAKMLQELPFDISPVVEDICSTLSVTFRLGEPFRRQYHQPLVYTVMRDRFDHYLTEQARAAGAQVRTRAPVRAISVEPEAVEVATDDETYRALALVGADGANSVVARSLGLARNLRYGVGLELEVRPSDTLRHPWDGTVGLDLGTIDLGGYGWVFPKRRWLSVGVGVHEGGGRRLKGYLENLTARWGLEGGSQAVRRSGHRLPMRVAGSPTYVGRALLAGDAAGMVDSLTGEGIYWAARSGKLAAVSVLELLRGRTADLSYYQQRLDQELMPELTIARRWAAAYRWAPSLCYAGLRYNERVWLTLCQLLRGDLRYQDAARALGPLSWLGLLATSMDGWMAQRSRSQQP